MLPLFRVEIVHFSEKYVEHFFKFWYGYDPTVSVRSWMGLGYPRPVQDARFALGMVGLGWVLAIQDLSKTHDLPLV